MFLKEHNEHQDKNWSFNHNLFSQQPLIPISCPGPDPLVGSKLPNLKKSLTDTQRGKNWEAVQTNKFSNTRHQN